MLFDRRTGKQSGATFLQKTGVGIMRLAARLSAGSGYFGMSRVNRLVGRTLLGSGETTFALNANTLFVVPSGDYYWAMLYNFSYSYEPDLERTLRAFRGLDYVLLDLGANFGYWSVLASSPEFGGKPVIAVEASERTYGYLAKNAAQRGGLIVAHRGAIWKTSGEVLNFFGTRHAGRSLVAKRSDAGEREQVTTITIADLVSLYADKIKASRLVVKLDIEGVEIAAMEGAAGVLDRIDAIIFEDSNNASFGETFFKVRDMTGFTVYSFDVGKGVFRALDTPYEIFDPRSGKRSLQSVGFNFIAVRPESPFAQQLSRA